MIISARAWAVLAGLVLAISNAAATQAGRDVLLEAELIPAQVYVQAQAVYRMRFFQAVDVRDLKIIGPSARLAEVRPIGIDTVNEAQRDGRRYRVHERRFAVFPFSSGELELSGAHVEGRVPATDATSVDGRQAIQLDAPARTLSVRPVPSELGLTPWLPARSLTLNETWAPVELQVKTGQILHRHIRIEALGVDAAQIPPIELVVPGMLIRAEAVKLHNRVVGELNMGVSEQSFSLVALQDGTIVLPQVRLPWWNLGDDMAAHATLASRTLSVRPGDANVAQILSPPLAPQPEISPPAQLKTKTSSTPNFLLLAGLAAFITVFLLAWFKRQRVRAVWSLRIACQSGKASAVRDALLEWAALIWPHMPPPTLEALGHKLDDPLAQDALATIDRCLYGPNDGRCDAIALSAAVRTIKRASPAAFLTRT